MPVAIEGSPRVGEKRICASPSVAKESVRRGNSGGHAHRISVAFRIFEAFQECCKDPTAVHIKLAADSQAVPLPTFPYTCEFPSDHPHLTFTHGCLS